MATFSTKLVCQARDGVPALGPLYLKYHFPETFYEGVSVPTVDQAGFFFLVLPWDLLNTFLVLCTEY